MSKRPMFAIGLAILCPHGPAAAQTPGDYMRQAVENVLVKAALLQETLGMSLIDGEVSVLGGFMDEGDRIGWTTTFHAGTRYALVGGGDQDVDDLDIIVYDENGDIAWQDVATDNYPVVEFEPRRTARYTVYLKLFDAPVASFAAMALLSENGVGLPISRLNEAVETYNLQVDVITDRMDVGSFHDEPNQWALYGVILDDGEDASISNMSMENGRHVVAASGDHAAEDIDLFLTDDTEADWVCKDDEPDAVPLISCWTNGSGKYRLRIENFDSAGRSLVIATVLER